MVVRVGIGATAAAAVIFTILLVSNALVFAASQDREHLYSVSNAEDSLGGTAAALMGAGGMNILLDAQSALAGRTLDCQAARAEAAAAIGNLSDFQHSGGVTVVSTARLAPEVPAGDNLSLLAPFNGSVAGELDISISMVATGRSPSGEVSLGKSEAHLVHIPIELDRLSADCLRALEGMAHTLSTEVPANCTSGAVDPFVQEASSSAGAAVSADGFGFGLEYTMVPGKDCGVGLLVWIRQAGIEGPGGPFTVQVEEEGLAFFGQPASAQRGGISQRTGP
ncbi:MAG: hypothetical protein JRN06_03680 [Nitrososphaerota archaeon]|nr:hypothetical protein [Nitrososphaerota archaeon]MDG7023042.1 hypothetical protein [Nitrososphaerota archaeon]